jgi:Stress responsive A/B Barrel Domain
MIAHIVLLKPKAESTHQEMKHVLDQVRTLQHTIPGIVDVQSGENISEKHQGYTFGFIMRFVDEAHLKAYAPHPAHLPVSEAIRRACSHVIDFDLAEQ